MSKAKNPHAVEMGKLGGRVGGKANTPAQNAARKANASRPRPNARKTVEKKEKQSS
jgi:hypothetical protein